MRWRFKKKWVAAPVTAIILLTALFFHSVNSKSGEGFCGVEKAGAIYFTGRACIWHGYQSNQPARLHIVSPSIDSGPAIYIVETGANARNVTILIDNTLDGMSSRTIERVSCSRMERKHMFSYRFNFKDCTQAGVEGGPFDWEL